MPRNIFLIALTAFFVGAVVFVLYWPGLFGGFFFDDGPSILQVVGIRMEMLTLESLHAALASGAAGPTGRPIAQLSFALNYMSSGYNAFAFKLTNLLIHYTCGLLVFYLSIHVLTGSNTRPKKTHIYLASTALAAFWLLHPIQLLPVLHIVQRMTSLSAVFFFAALLLHIRGRERADSVGLVFIALAWFILWPLSVFSKETGVLFPLFVLAWELILYRHTNGSLDRFARVLIVGTGLLILSGLIYTLRFNSEWIWAGYKMRSFSVLERLLTECRIVWFYLGLIFSPRMEGLGLYHDDIALSTNLITPWTTLPAIAGLLGLIWVGWRARAKSPLVSFGIAWFFISHIVESTILPLELAHEHRNYVALFGVLLCGAWALIESLQKSGELRTTGVTIVVATLCYFSLITGLRADQFGDPARRTQVEAQQHRNSARAQHEAGQYLASLTEAANANEPIYSLASAHFQRACELDNTSKMCLLGIIYLNCKAGIKVQPTLISELGRRLNETPFAPGDRNVLNSVKEMSIDGTLCLSRTDVEELFAAAVANQGVAAGVKAMLYSWHADYLWLHEQDIVAASKALDQSLKLNPVDLSSRLKLAQLIYISGDRVGAYHLLLELSKSNINGEERRTIEELLATYPHAGH